MWCVGWVCLCVCGEGGVCGVCVRGCIEINSIVIIGRAGASPPSRATRLNFLYIYFGRTVCTLTVSF